MVLNDTYAAYAAHGAGDETSSYAPGKPVVLFGSSARWGMEMIFNRLIVNKNRTMGDRGYLKESVFALLREFLSAFWVSKKQRKDGNLAGNKM